MIISEIMVDFSAFLNSLSSQCWRLLIKLFISFPTFRRTFAIIRDNFLACNNNFNFHAYKINPKLAIFILMIFNIKDTTIRIISKYVKTKTGKVRHIFIKLRSHLSYEQRFKCRQLLDVLRLIKNFR